MMLVVYWVFNCIFCSKKFLFRKRNMKIKLLFLKSIYHKDGSSSYERELSSHYVCKYK